MAHPFFLNMLDLAGINSAILCEEVPGEKLSRKDYLLSSVAEMQQTSVNTGATYEETDDDMEFQEVSTLRKRKQCQVRLNKNSHKCKSCHKCKQTCGKCTSKV